ncbi:sialate O-acetylesterase domain-containing protein [Pseudoscourfieldia marina]
MELLSQRLSVVILFLYLIVSTLACSDNDARISAEAAARGQPEISGCVDVKELCGASGTQGDGVRQLCCVTCEGVTEPVDTGNGLTPGAMDLPAADGGEPVQLFLLAGQSNCVGQASAGLMQRNDAAKYPALVGKQPGVWFAGKNAQSQFVIHPMEAGQTPAISFGPELSFGQRVREVVGKRVMMVKYCWGGSKVATHWNPSTPENSWDTAADDGTAAWLAKNGAVDMTNKNALFPNLMYVARMAAETLAGAGVAYEWKAFLWVQGSGDRADTYVNIGRNTARLFDAVRSVIGVPALPVVDTGAGPHHSLSTGKALAAQLVERCEVAWVEYGDTAANPASSCIPGPTNPCPNVTFLNHDFYNHYGWDPAIPAESLPSGANDKKFRWFKDYPNNLHAEYDGKILEGRMLANAYIRAFTSSTLPAAMAAQDPALLFPWVRCAEGVLPTAKALCWVDQRTAEEKVEPERCTLQKPPVEGPTTTTTTTATTAAATTAAATTTAAAAAPSPPPPDATSAGAYVAAAPALALAAAAAAARL